VNPAPTEDAWDLLNRKLAEGRKAAEEKQTRGFWNKKIADLLAEPEELQEKPREEVKL
jgi:hypothetical protein